MCHSTWSSFLPASLWYHYNDVIMSPMASQITSLTIVYSTVYSRRRSKKTAKLRVTGLCEGGGGGVIGEFPSQRAINAENVSICWRHHVSNHLIGLVLQEYSGLRIIKIHSLFHKENHLYPGRYYLYSKEDNAMKVKQLPFCLFFVSLRWTRNHNQICLPSNCCHWTILLNSTCWNVT